MNITVNDEVHQYPGPLSVADLIGRLGLADKPVAVELNLELIPKQQHTDTWLQDGDRLEIVSLTGGG